MEEEMGLYIKHQNRSESRDQDEPSSAVEAIDSVTSKPTIDEKESLQHSAPLPTNTTRSTSSTSPVPPAGIWGGYLRRTLAQVEQQIDKVLLDDTGKPSGQKLTAQEGNGSVSSPTPTRPSHTADFNSDSQRSSNESARRLPMQERLAAAVSKSSSSRNSQRPVQPNSPVSMDQRSTPQPEQGANGSTGLVTESSPQSLEMFIDNGNPGQAIISPELGPQEQSSSQVDNDSSNQEIKSVVRGRSSDSGRSEATEQHNEHIKDKSGGVGLRSIFKATQPDVSSSSNIESRLAEKEEKIQLLIEEGERMSKTELKHMNTIKRLRTQERQTKDENGHLKQQMEKLRKEIDQLKDNIKKLTDQNRELSDRLKSTTKMEQDLIRLRKERDDLMVSNSKTRQQLAEAIAKAESAFSEAESDALETERSKCEKLRQQLAEIESERALAAEKAAGDIARLEARLDREMRNSQTAQTTLQKENAELEMQLENSRSRVEELSSTSSKVSQARLLRQVESLQSQHADATANWREIEESLSTRITKLEAERDEAVDKFTDFRKRLRESGNETKSLTSDLQSSKDKISRLETKLSLREDTVKELESQLSEAKQRIRILDQACESERENARDKVEDIRSSLRRQQEEYQELQDHYRQMQGIVQQFQQQQNVSSSSFSLRSPSFNRRVGNISEDLMDWNAHTAAATISVPVSPNSPRIVSGRTSSYSGYPQRGSSTNASANTSSTSLQQYSSSQTTGTPGDVIYEGSYDVKIESPSPDMGSMSGALIEDSSAVDDDSGIRPFSSPVLNGTQTPSVSTTPGGRASNRANSKVGSSAAPVHLVERMGATVRRLESEMAASREEIARLKEQNSDQQNEMVELLRHARDRDALGERNEQLAEQIKDLQAREQTALEMLGEKSEQASELQADLADIKALYKSQIEELIEQLSQAKLAAAAAAK